MTNEIMPFNFESIAVRVVMDDSGDPLFVGKDICEALGYSDTVNAIKQHCRGVVKRHPIVDSLGRTQETRVLSEPDVLRLIIGCTLPAAQAFEKLVFEEILPTIRKTGAYSTPNTPSKPDSAHILDATKLFIPFNDIALAIGCDKGAAAISANQAVLALSGTNILQLMGQTHIASANQESIYYTPTELGKRIGTSARGMNLLLAESGFQMKRGEHWEVTDAGKDFARIYDTGKKHGTGVPVQQIKWSAEVIPAIGKDVIEVE